ncbi:MAG: four helix bundle protein [Longimicrobiales bacterium]
MTEAQTPENDRLPPDIERFDFEDDEVFEIAVEIAVLGDPIADQLRDDRPWAATQVGKSSFSVATNTGEAQGEHSPGDKARFYRYDRRSATETAAATVVLGRREVISIDQEIRIRRLLLSAVKSLTRRIIHFEGISRARTRGWLERKY